MMTNKGRGLGAAFILAVAASWGVPLLAQQTNTIGPAELRDFRLPGQRTTPPAPAEQPPAEAEPRQPEAITPAPTPAAPRSAPRPLRPKRRRRAPRNGRRRGR
jgi:hypothetical protein